MRLCDCNKVNVIVIELKKQKPPSTTFYRGQRRFRRMVSRIWVCDIGQELLCDEIIYHMGNIGRHMTWGILYKKKLI